MQEEKETMPKKKGTKQVKPLKDFVILQNDFRLELEKGKSVEVPSKFLANLKTEKVI